MADAVSLVGRRVGVWGFSAVGLFVVLDEDAKQDDESDLDAQQKRNVTAVHQEMLKRHFTRLKNSRSFLKFIYKKKMAKKQNRVITKGLQMTSVESCPDQWRPFTDSAVTDCDLRDLIHRP